MTHSSRVRLSFAEAAVLWLIAIAIGIMLGGLGGALLATTIMGGLP